MSSITSIFARLFARPQHNVENDEKHSKPQVAKLISTKAEKTGSKDSTSKIARFFQKLFQSKEKAQECVHRQVFPAKSSWLGIFHVKKRPPNVVDESTLQEIAANSAAPPQLGSDKTSNQEMGGENTRDDGAPAAAPRDRYAQLDHSRSFVESEEGRFMFDIVNMGTCLVNLKSNFRIPPELALEKTLTAAFQIYFDEGKLIHPKSVATPNWGSPATFHSLEDLGKLTADLGKISAYSEADKALLDKAIQAIQGRSDRIRREQQTLKSDRS